MKALWMKRKTIIELVEALCRFATNKIAVRLPKVLSLMGQYFSFISVVGAIRVGAYNYSLSVWSIHSTHIQCVL